MLSSVLRLILFAAPFIAVVWVLCLSAESQRPELTGFDEDPFAMGGDAFSAPFPTDDHWLPVSRAGRNELRLAGEIISCGDLPQPLRCLPATGEDFWIWTGVGALLLTEQQQTLSQRALKQSPSSVPERLRLKDACQSTLASQRWTLLRGTWLAEPWRLLGELGLSAPAPGLPGYGIEVAPAQWLSELRLQLGDRVLAVDGLPLDARHIPKLVERLVDASQFSLTLWRSGEVIARRYCIASADAA